MPCTNSRFRVGQFVGPYALLECKGEGGFGEVWKAQRKDVMAAPPVALKLSRYPQLHQEPVREEAERWAKLTGLPNVLPVIEANNYNGEVVIASLYIDGGTLTQWLQHHNGKAPTIQAAVDIAAGILMGLEGLHSRGIVHRDLKPDNILMQGEMPLLTDFGISRIVESTVAYTQHTMGTLNYMPPEAFDTSGTKSQVSKKSDQWAVAVILYRLLTGQLPFPQVEWGPYMNAIAHQSPPPLPNTVPAHIKRVLSQALQKYPEKRFASAAAMRTALLTPNSQSQQNSRLDFLNSLFARLSQPIASSIKRSSEQPTVAVPSATGDNRSRIHWAFPVVGLFIALFLGIGVYHEPGLSGILIPLGILALSEWALLRIPVRLSHGRPITRHSLLLPIIVSGFWFMILVFGIFVSIMDAFPKGGNELLASVIYGAIGGSWVVWSILFYKMTKTADPKSHIEKQMRLLLRGSILELLIAVPSHVVARQRHDCCAGIASLFGITMGLVVMAISFGPGVYFLYRERLQKKRIGKR
jgi:serine/threonine protein kinase